MRKRRIDDKPTMDLDLHDFGEVMQERAEVLARRLEACGADASRYLWPCPSPDQRRAGEVIEIPARLADLLHAVMLSLVPRPKGRPPKRSTMQARELVKAGRTKRDISRLLASANDSSENIRAALRPKPRKSTPPPGGK
jgi:hypothetical protein